jgi:hypothetical protein
VHIFRRGKRHPEQMFNHAVPRPVLFSGHFLNFPEQIIGDANGDLREAVIIVLVHTSIFVKTAGKINGL